MFFICNPQFELKYLFSKRFFQFEFDEFLYVSIRSRLTPLAVFRLLGECLCTYFGQLF
jgi:hypothetical protein